MKDSYAEIVIENHKKLFRSLSPALAENLPAVKEGDNFTFNAFGETCKITPDGFFLGTEIQYGATGIILSLYALNANNKEHILKPFKAYREFPDTMPYVGAFATHTENILIPHIQTVKSKIKDIADRFNGFVPENDAGGDFSFVVYPLPKIALNYIFYEADDDFPASVKCLFSNNASGFITNDALADTGEYTSKKIIEIL